MKTRSSKTWIITGAREIGKTRFCSHLIEKARSERLVVAGLLSPPVYANGVKTIIEVEDLRSRECKILARSRRDNQASIQTKRWSFDTEALNWGNDILAKAIPCDLLVVDELGLLEFERGGGWQNGISAVHSGKFRVAVVVIRPELIDQALVVFKKARVLEIAPHWDSMREQEMIKLILKEFISTSSPI